MTNSVTVLREDAVPLLSWLMTTDARRAKITDEHKQEAKRLLQLWDERPGIRLSQTEFGELYGIGNQSAVRQFLHAITPLSMKAALGFVQGLTDAGYEALQLADISPRLAGLAQQISAATPALSKDEQALVDAFRRCDSRSRALMLRTFVAMASGEDEGRRAVDADEEALLRNIRESAAAAPQSRRSKS